ncbi:hypothetical protein ABMA27_012986 [Loxostege sticticalis]|uniref:Uncharacterized protein n=1 Tax=Loxostege sticticalis TaxID=481309 RepID=A0ABR3IDM5_LOXSC
MRLSRKKAAQVQLQAELNTDEDWNKFLQRDGLLVVDVYTEWCGPCIGMVGNLKKIKVELGGDNLHLAVAKSDTIECLKRFRKRSEPTWMFIAAGQLLNVVFGADAPRLTRTIEQELRNEELARKGEMERPQRAPSELTPPELEVATAQAKLQEERKKREEAALQEARVARREARARKMEKYFEDTCPALIMPHAQKSLRKVGDLLEQNGVIVADKCPILVGKDDARRLAVEDPELKIPAALTALAERPAMSLILKKLPETEGCVVEISRRALCGDGEEEGEEPKKTMYEDLRVDGVPGLFVPKDRHQRAAALDILFPKMVGAVLEPPASVQPPHIAMMFGAWQRRAVLSAAATPAVAARVLKYGFFADTNVQEPKLLAKTIDKYDERTEKDYCETIVLMIAVGLPEPELAEPGTEMPEGPPAELMILGPLHVSGDSVVGMQECARFFPPGYSESERKPKSKSKKKKKKRHENKEESAGSTEAPPEPETEAAAGGEGEGEGSEENGEERTGESDSDENNGEDAQAVDKATSPPPATPH